MIPQPVISEYTYPTTASRIWKAMTVPAEMEEWYFKLPGFRTEKGYTFSFLAGDPDKKLYNHLCEVTDAVPEKKLAYTWRYEGYDGNSLVTFELFPTGTATTLRVTHTGLETFPESNPDLAPHNFQAGWDRILNDYLKHYLEK